MRGPESNPTLGRHTVVRRVLVIEALCFAAVIAIIWANELFDIPYLILGSNPSDINFQEALFESLCVGILGIVVVAYNSRFLARIKYLEGFLVICAFCKKIRVEEDRWVPIEEFLRDRTHLEFSHSYCPACLEKHYGSLLRTAKKSSARQVDSASEERSKDDSAVHRN